MRRFRIRLAGFRNLNFFIRDQMANTNAKTPRFRLSVNEPLRNRRLLNGQCWQAADRCIKAKALHAGANP